MKEFKDKLVYLKDEEIDELIGIGVLSLQRLVNLKDYYPFILRYPELQRDDILYRINKSLNNSGVEISLNPESIKNSEVNEENFKLLNQEFYWCSAKKSIPMDELIRVIFDYVNTNNSVNFPQLYDYLRMYFKRRSFNRSNLMSLLIELNAIENRYLIKSFEVPGRFKPIEVSNKIQNEFYEKNLFPIIETNLAKELIEYYPDVNDFLRNIISKIIREKILNNIDEESFSQLIDYLRWIHNSNVLQSRNMLANYFHKIKDSRNIAIFQERCAITTRPKTLEEIGFDYGITRERVRQISSKIAYKVSTISKLISDYLLYTNDQRTISVEFIKIVFPNFTKEVLFSLMTTDNYLLSNSGLQLVLSLDDDKYNTPFLNNKHLQFTEEEFNLILKNEVSSDDSVLINYYYQHLNQNYHRIGDFFVIRGLNNYKLMVLLIDQYFLDGIELNNNEQLERLYSIYEKVTGRNDFLDKTKRAVTARLADQLDLIGKGTYTSRRNLSSLSEATKVEIRDIAKSVLPKPVYYDFVYKNLVKEKLYLDEIRNHHHLHGLMKVYMEDDYIYHKDYFALELIDAFLPEVERELLSLNRIVTEKDLKHLSTSQSKTSITNLNYSGNWIYIGNNKYLPKSFIEREKEFVFHLKQLALKLLGQHDVFHISLLFPYIDKTLFQLKEDFGIDNSTALSNLLSHVSEGEWRQRNNYLFNKELKFNNRYDVTKYLIRDMDRISFQELYYRVSQIGDKVFNGLMLIDNLLPEYCRISEHELIKTSNITISSQQLSEIDAMIGALLFSRNGIILSKLKSYAKFPMIDYDWNEHLLASVIRMNFEHYRMIYTDNSYINTSYLIVNSSAPFETFEQFNKTEENNE